MMNCELGCKGSQDKIGVLIAQLGTPDAPTPKALKPYLKEFLSDFRVIEANRFIWWFILNCIVLVTRPKRSARLYKRIWGKDGSPLLMITRKQTDGVRERLRNSGLDIEVEFGMRYGNPSLASAIDSLSSKGVKRILLFPMYPQYAAATTASTYDAVFKKLLNGRWIPTLKIAEPYYRHPAYVDALASTMNESIAKLDWKPEKVVLSYHGIPEKYVKKGDPYCCQCVETTEALSPKINLGKNSVIHTFQSRFGRDPWLTPYTDETFEKLGREGVTDIAVAAPGFTADCLETLDELGNEGREQFLHAGGKRYHLIPCLNDQPVWLDSMTEIITEELGSWIQRQECRSPWSAVKCPLVSAGKQCA